MKRRIIHVVDWRDLSKSKDRERVMQAQESWQYMKSRGVVQWRYGLNEIAYLRSSDVEIGDDRRLPFLKDLLASAMEVAGDEDIILWTNDDNWLHPEIVDLLHFHVPVYDVCTSRRCEISKMPPLVASPEDFAKLHEGHIGRDLLACTKQWLENHLDEIPDFVLGTSRFDLALAYIVRRYHGYELDSIQSLEANVWPAELPNGYVVHVRHTSHWSQNTESPSELHNKRLFEEFSKGLK